MQRFSKVLVPIKVDVNHLIMVASSLGLPLPHINEGGKRNLLLPHYYRGVGGDNIIVMVHGTRNTPSE